MRRWDETRNRSEIGFLGLYGGARDAACNAETYCWIQSCGWHVGSDSRFASSSKVRIGALLLSALFECITKERKTRGATARERESMRWLCNYWPRASFCRRRWSRSSVMVSLTPPPRGIEIMGLPSAPMTKTLERRVEKSRPSTSRR